MAPSIFLSSCHHMVLDRPIIFCKFGRIKLAHLQNIGLQCKFPVLWVKFSFCKTFLVWISAKLLMHRIVSSQGATSFQLGQGTKNPDIPEPLGPLGPLCRPRVLPGTRWSTCEHLCSSGSHAETLCLDRGWLRIFNIPGGGTTKMSFH